MKSTGKHRASSAAPRNGAAALMIGGLVAGTVATAGATTLGGEPTPGTAAPTASEQPSAVSTADRAQEGAVALASLRSASLSELRDQTAADRSQARKAPADAASVATVLEGSAFTGETVQVEVVEEVAEAAPAEQAGAPAQSATTQAAPQQQAPQRQQATQQQTATTTQQAAAPAAPAPAAPAPVGGGIVGIAQQYVGYPYVLGGTPPSTFDCSSFTWWVFQQAGIDIPRTVAGQKAAVTPVSNPQPGDLVFTTSFYHVGIYAGNGMVIEALNAGSGVTYGAPVYGGIWYGRITG
jgi:cell wall-associated NlpC family hydrolase